MREGTSSANLSRISMLPVARDQQADHQAVPRLATALWALGVALASWLGAGDLSAGPAKPKKPRTVDDPAWASAPSHKHASMSRESCLVDLRRLGVRFREAGPARGVLAPIRLEGPLGGVVWRTELSAAERATSPHELVDCRLALALHELGPALAARGIDEAVVHSFWRPPPASWPLDRANVRHPGGLAVDVKRFGRGKAKDLVVARDWRPAIGAPPCASGARLDPPTTEAAELRALFCELARERRFTSMLSPNYDRAHHDHFHLELRPGVRWRIVL
jgi:hypothetical protein